MADTPQNGVKLPPGATLVKQPAMPAVKLPPGATLVKSGGTTTSPAAPPPASGLPGLAGGGSSYGAKGPGFAKSRGGGVTFDEFMQGAEAWARGASLGVSDDASAALAATILKVKGDPHTMYQLYQALDNAENERIDAWEKGHPYVGKGVEFAGSMMTPGAGRLGEWIGSGAGWLTRMGRAALIGAGAGGIGGWGYAKPGEKSKGAIKGAAVGTMAGPIIQTAGEVIGPKITDAAEYLRTLGVKPTIGQNVGGAAKQMEEKLSSVPVVGSLIQGQQRTAVEEFNRAAYNEVLAPLGQKVPKEFPVGNEGFAKLDDMLSEKYEVLLPKLTFQPVADLAFKREIAAVDQVAATLPDAQREQYINLMNNYVAGRLKNGEMSGTAFKGSESELAAEARGILLNPNSSFYEKKLAYTLKDAIGVMRDSLDRTNPEFSGELRPLNESYMLLTRVQKAASRLGAKDGIFTPPQLLSAVRAGASEKQFARGEAPLQQLAQAADRTLGNKYPDSGTAGRLSLMHLLNPEVAVTAAIGSLPYLLPRGWNASPFAQSTAEILRSMIPAIGAQGARAVEGGNR